MISQDQIRDLIGAQLIDSSGSKVGKVGQIYFDDDTGAPEWATVHTGMFGTNESFVPLADAQVSGDELRVPYSKDQIKDAPNCSADGHLEESEEAELYSHYGLDYGRSRSDSGVAEGSAVRAGTGGDTSRGRSGKTTGDGMTRSEERLHAGTERVQTGTVKLRKWVETEEQQIKVPVTKEKARVVTEPITEGNRDDALSGPEITEGEHEVTLTEERPVVAKETVPVERVRLEKDIETDEEVVSEEVRKERIEGDGIDLRGERQSSEKR